MTVKKNSLFHIALMSKHMYDTIYHLAAVTHVRWQASGV